LLLLTVAAAATAAVPLDLEAGAPEDEICSNDSTTFPYFRTGRINIDSTLDSVTTLNK